MDTSLLKCLAHSDLHNAANIAIPPSGGVAAGAS
jgi:hypothetical protein